MHGAGAEDRTRAARGGDEAVAAVRNATALAASLVATWAIALVVRIAIPRFLGPEAFGLLNASDALAATGLVFAGLGIDTYIRKEVPVRPGHASDFFGGVLLVRAGVALVLILAMAAVQHRIGRPAAVIGLTTLFGLAQFAVTVNASLAALLHARGRVGAFSVMQVGAKVLWGVGILLGGLAGHLLVAVPAALLASELVKAAVLLRLTRRHVGLRLGVAWPAAAAALRASAPFYVNAVVITAYARMDQTLLSFLAADPRELGWYGAAAALGAISMLLSPVVGWVLLPLFARAASRSGEELARAVSKSVEVILSIAIPVSLLLGLGAGLWVRTLFGAPFAPATTALAVLAPSFPLTYLGCVAAVCLNLVGRGWRTTTVTSFGLGLNVALNLVLVPRALAGGTGGAGIACAASMLASEALVTAALVYAASDTGFGRRTLWLIGRAAVAAAAVVALDRALLSSLGNARLAIDVAAWVLFSGALRAVRWTELLRFARSAWIRPDENAA